MRLEFSGSPEIAAPRERVWQRLLEGHGVEPRPAHLVGHQQFSRTVAGIGARLMEGAARRLTEQFWTDFARRVVSE